LIESGHKPIRFPEVKYDFLDFELVRGAAAEHNRRSCINVNTEK